MTAQPPTPQPNPDEWVSQHQAAQELGIHVLRIGYLITHDHLEPIDSPTRKHGVTRTSLDAEKTWRTQAPWVRRKLRPVLDILKDLLNGF